MDLGIAGHCVIFRNRPETFWIWQGTLQRGEFWLLSTTLHHRWASVQASHRDQTWRSLGSSSVPRLCTLFVYGLQSWKLSSRLNRTQTRWEPESRTSTRTTPTTSRSGRATTRPWKGDEEWRLTLMHIFDSWTSVYPTPNKQYDLAYAKLPNNILSLYSDLIWGWT